MNREKLQVSRIIVRHNEEKRKDETLFLDYTIYYDQIDSFGQEVLGDVDVSNCVRINFKSGKSIVIVGDYEKYQVLIGKYDQRINKQIKSTILN